MVKSEEVEKVNPVCAKKCSRVPRIQPYEPTLEKRLDSTSLGAIDRGSPGLRRPVHLRTGARSPKTCA